LHGLYSGFRTSTLLLFFSVTVCNITTPRFLTLPPPRFPTRGNWFSVSNAPTGSIISNEQIAESCLNRIVHTAYRFELKGESLRKKR